MKGLGPLGKERIKTLRGGASEDPGSSPKQVGRLGVLGVLGPTERALSEQEGIEGQGRISLTESRIVAFFLATRSWVFSPQLWVLRFAIFVHNGGAHHVPVAGIELRSHLHLQLRILHLATIPHRLIIVSHPQQRTLGLQIGAQIQQRCREACEERRCGCPRGNVRGRGRGGERGGHHSCL